MIEIEPRPTVQGDRLLVKLITGYYVLPWMLDVTQRQYFVCEMGGHKRACHATHPQFSQCRSHGTPLKTIETGHTQGSEFSYSMAARARVSQLRGHWYFYSHTLACLLEHNRNASVFKEQT